MFKALPFIIRDFILLNLLFTAIGTYFFVQYGNYFIPYFFWLKLIGFVIIWLAVIVRSSRIFFYNNLGLSKPVLLIIVIAMDWLLAVIFLIGTSVVA